MCSGSLGVAIPLVKIILFSGVNCTTRNVFSEHPCDGCFCFWISLCIFAYPGVRNNSFSKKCAYVLNFEEATPSFRLFVTVKNRCCLILERIHKKEGNLNLPGN